ncbi:hypothetical protein [Devosia sp.]|uniref:hypothetical protein n=1 Tax=Devosia sp. TaxID=1871048 RepID=UPI0035B2E999
MSKPLKHPSPLSVRLTQAERDALLARAGRQTLSAYVKQCLFDTGPITPRNNGLTLANQTLLAHLLATLGASQLASNLDRLAREAEDGELFPDDDTIMRLREACDDVRLMHNALMRGLGKREKKPSYRQVQAAKAFNAASDPSCAEASDDEPEDDE